MAGHVSYSMACQDSVMRSLGQNQGMISYRLSHFGSDTCARARVASGGVTSRDMYRTGTQYVQRGQCLAAMRTPTCSRSSLKPGRCPTRPTPRAPPRCRPPPRSTCLTCAPCWLDHGAKCERRGPHGVRALQMAGWANSAETAEVLARKLVNRQQHLVVRQVAGLSNRQASRISSVSGRLLRARKLKVGHSQASPQYLLSHHTWAEGHQEVPTGQRPRLQSSKVPYPRTHTQNERPKDRPYVSRCL